MPITSKRYACVRCGHVVQQETNHYGETYNWGHFNCCPACPPWAKYPEFGGSTRWRCLEEPPKEQNGNNKQNSTS